MKHKLDIEEDEKRKKFKRLVIVGKHDHDYNQMNNVGNNASNLYENQVQNLNDGNVLADQRVQDALGEEEYGEDTEDTNEEVTEDTNEKDTEDTNEEDTEDTNEEYTEDTNEEDSEEETVNSSSEDILDEKFDNEIPRSNISKSLSHKISSTSQSQAKRNILMKNSLNSNTDNQENVVFKVIRNQSHIRSTSKSSYNQQKVSEVSGQYRKPGVNEKFPHIPIPSHINQYGDCLKTRLGRHHYGLTLNDRPCQFFQGVLKGASGQTLAAMFGDVDLIAKLESIPLDEIGHFVFDTTFKVIPNGTEGINRVVTISLLHQNVVIPLWYAVTSCSSFELYKRILIEFQQHVLDWPFTSVLLNNDPILCKAVQAVFPDIDVHGSWFHYCYSIWREVSLNNLTEQCKAENSMLLTAVKLLMVVPYLPPCTTNNPSLITMVDGFEYVREFASENDLPEEFNRVLDNVADFWFNKVKRENFTLFEKHGSVQNYIEILQLFLLSYMKPNGNIWILTSTFQNIAKSTHADFIRSLNGNQPKFKKSSGKKFKFSGLIRMNEKKLMTGSLDVKEFLEKSTIYLEEILNIFLHPLYVITTFEKINYTHTEGWAIRNHSD